MGYDYFWLFKSLTIRFRLKMPIKSENLDYGFFLSYLVIFSIFWSYIWSYFGAFYGHIRSYFRGPFGHIFGNFSVGALDIIEVGLMIDASHVI